MLDGVSLRVEPGSLMQIKGGNGSGKSTLLRIACGFTRPTHGRVHREFASFALVPDRAVPPPRMSALTYLHRLGRLSGMNTSTVTEAAESIAGALGLVPGLRAPLGELSRGNQRKVLLIQALMRPAALVVLDEPFTALDAEAAAALTALLQDRLGRGAALLVALHGDELAGAGDVLELEAGRLRAARADGVSAAHAPMATIELAGPQPDDASGGEVLKDGRVRYRVAEPEVEQFLRAALAAGTRVLRVEPPDGGSDGGR